MKYSFKGSCAAFRLVLLLALVGFMGLAPLAGQNATGTIIGTVADTSGGVVPEASVQVRNSGTGIVLNLTADAQGRFRVSDLNVGEYEVTVAKMGFSTVVHKGIVLAVGSQSLVDFSLPLGQQQQTVTVEGQVSQVETTSAALGAITTETQMRELPLNGRNFEQLIQLAPGVASVQVNGNAMMGRAAQYSVAGGRPEGQAITLDDENLQSFWNNGISSITGSSLGVEAIGEFQTLTNTYSAQFGGNGAVINAVSRSGTNAFHGSAFEFLRNSALDARDYFLLTQSSPPPFRRNQFGGSIGGPVVKDKAFFFFDYEGVRQFLQQSGNASVPNCANPAACTPAPGLSPAVKQAIADTLALYPKPDPGRINTQDGGLTGFSTQFGNNVIHENYFLTRFDYVFSPSDSIFARYFADKATGISPFAGSNGPSGGGPLPFWPGYDRSLSQYSTIEERHIFTPSLVNLARISFSRPTRGSDEPDHATAPNGHEPLQFYPASKGLMDGYVSIPGLTPLGPAAGTGRFTFATTRYAVGDDLLWTKGSHSIRMGIGYEKLIHNTWNPIAENGNWTFSSLQGFLQASPAQLFLIVLPSPTATAHRDFIGWNLNPYIQDDWKITRKLALNLGVRWEFYSNPTERHDNLFVIKNFATDTGFTRVPTVFQSNPSWYDIDPRIGLAFDPFADHKTAIRAGFGLFHNPISAQAYQVGFGTAPPWAFTALPSVLFSATGCCTYPNVPSPTAQVPSLPSTAAAWYWPMNTTPYMIQYNASVQREFVGTVFTLGYVGSRGVHLLTAIEANPPTPVIDGSGTYHFSNAAGKQNPRLNPALGYFPAMKAMTSSNYNSLQVIANRRTSKGLTMQASYTWSKCMDTGAFGIGTFNGPGSPGQIENPFDARTDHAPCSYDITQNLRANGIYALPFHGNRLIEGWQIGAVLSAYSGVPINVNDGFDRAVISSYNTPRPNYVAGCDPYQGARTAGKWFNTACYALEPVGTFGNTGRNTLRGPGFFNTDVSLSKDTRLAEQFKLQFRAEFFNIFNHENFGLPNNNVFNASGTVNGNAGVISATSAGSTPRQIQFGLKLIF